MIDLYALARALNDSEYHTREQLAKIFSVEPIAISNRMARLPFLGIEVETVPGRGFRLARRLELLDARMILQAVNPQTRNLIAAIEVLPEIDSTNTQLMRAGAAGAPAGQICLAELQTAGKGRNGQPWISPFAANLYMSLLWRFDQQSIKPGRLTTGIGIAMADALSSLGAREIALKWPNDIFWRRRKLGGILVEMAGGARTSSYVVIGVGLNIRMPEMHARKIDQPCTDLFTVMNGSTPSPNLLAPRLIEAIVAQLVMFQHGGRKDIEHAWRKYDCNLGCPVALHTPNGLKHGIANGIDADGRLLLSVDGRQRAFTCGEVSSRSRL